MTGWDMTGWDRARWGILRWDTLAGRNRGGVDWGRVGLDADVLVRGDRHFAWQTGSLLGWVARREQRGSVPLWDSPRRLRRWCLLLDRCSLLESYLLLDP